jgi:hypothetical protein
MFRSIGLLIIGITALASGVARLGSPAQEVEKSGWIYQHYGPQGVAYGTIVLGIVCLSCGIVMFNCAWRQIRQVRQLGNKKQTER